MKIALFYALCTVLGIYFIAASHATFKQFIFCVIGLALLEPFCDLITAFIVGVFK